MSINFDTAITLEQAANLILATPMNRYMLVGEPGIGKSSLLKYIASKLPNHKAAYIDVPNMDLGDTAMPVIDHETRTTRYYPNARFGLHTGKPVAIMLDEYSKGADPVKNMLHPLLEVANPRLGDIPVPDGSYIFLTGNLSTDGVGDNLKAHSRNRLVIVKIRKPSAAEWLLWAADNDIDPSVMAWVDRYPHCLASYMDADQESNPYIYNPKAIQFSFVTPRSLERASNIVSARNATDAHGKKTLDTDTIIAALKGAIGEAAARDMQAYVDYQDQLPSWDAITTDPTNTPIPATSGACSVLTFGALQRVDKHSFASVMQYIGRLDPQWQAAFCISIAKGKKQNIAFSSAAFKDWITKNEDIL